jgi:excisionase family DNA binding protein
VTRSALDGQVDDQTIKRRGGRSPSHKFREFVMEQYLLNLSDAHPDGAGEAVVRHNVWLLSPEEIPPILFTTEEVGRMLGIGRPKVYDLLRCNELRSVKVGASRRVSAKALREYVDGLELREPA